MAVVDHIVAGLIHVKRARKASDMVILP